MTEPKVFLDLLGRELKIGDCIVVPGASYASDNLWVGRITKFTPKKVRFVTLNRTHNTDGIKDPNDCVLVDEAAVMFYLLQKGSK